MWVHLIFCKIERQRIAVFISISSFRKLKSILAIARAISHRDTLHFAQIYFILPRWQRKDDTLSSTETNPVNTYAMWTLNTEQIHVWSGRRAPANGDGTQLTFDEMNSYFILLVFVFFLFRFVVLSHWFIACCTKCYAHRVCVQRLFY